MSTGGGWLFHDFQPPALHWSGSRVDLTVLDWGESRRLELYFTTRRGGDLLMSHDNARGKRLLVDRGGSNVDCQTCSMMTALCSSTLAVCSTS